MVIYCFEITSSNNEISCLVKIKSTSFHISIPAQISYIQFIFGAHEPFENNNDICPGCI